MFRHLRSLRRYGTPDWRLLSFVRHWYWCPICWVAEQSLKERFWPRKSKICYPKLELHSSLTFTHCVTVLKSYSVEASMETKASHRRQNSEAGSHLEVRSLHSWLMKRPEWLPLGDQVESAQLQLGLSVFVLSISTKSLSRANSTLSLQISSVKEGRIELSGSKLGGEGSYGSASRICIVPSLYAYTQVAAPAIWWFRFPPIISDISV